MGTKRKSGPKPSAADLQTGHGASLKRVARGLAYVEVASTELAREINRDVLLELIRLRQPIARADLARASGLQNSTVSSIVEQLLREGWIVEGPIVKTARGRRPTLLSLNTGMAMLVADVHPERATLAIVDLNGACHAQSQISVGNGAKRGVKDIVAGLKRLRESHPTKRIEGVGVCLPGRVQPGTNRLVLAPNLDWREFDIRKAIADGLDLPAELENDANACLLSELWFGHIDGIRNAVLLAISEGVGAAILADGRLISGSMGLAGEFGHVIYDPEGPLCGCGQRGCWEMFASSAAALRYYRERQPDAPSMLATELIGRALAGENAARAAIERQAEAIGKGLRMINASLSPEVILFAGEITESWDLAAPIIERECAAGLLGGTSPRLVSLRGGDAAHLRGAAAVVLQRHSGYYRSRSAAKASKSGGSSRPSQGARR